MAGFRAGHPSICEGTRLVRPDLQGFAQEASTESLKVTDSRYGRSQVRGPTATLRTLQRNQLHREYQSTITVEHDTHTNHKISLDVWFGTE
jgi:hypothetical protein